MNAGAGSAAGLTAGFIGLGDMGGAIAERIVEAGIPLIVHDVRQAAIDRLAGFGAQAAVDPSTLATAADIVFVCVVNDEQVMTLVRDSLSAMRDGSILIVVSSVRPETMRAAAELLPQVAVLDAPVSGSRPAAAAGTLTLIVGGDEAALERARPVLASFSERIFHTGTLGTGQVTKIANNVMLHMNHLIALEAVRFARGQGIDEATLIEIANTSSGRSWVTETWGLIDGMFRDHPQAGTPGIYDMMVKEMWNAVLLGKDTHTWLPLTALGVQVGQKFHEERERDLGIGRPTPA